MGNPPIYGQAQQATGVNPAAGTAVDPPAPQNSMEDLEARVAAMVEARVSAVEAKYQDRIADLEASLNRNQPASLLPEHSAGPGCWKSHQLGLSTAKPPRQQERLPMKIG